MKGNLYDITAVIAKRFFFISTPTPGRTKIYSQELLRKLVASLGPTSIWGGGIKRAIENLTSIALKIT